MNNDKLDKASFEASLKPFDFYHHDFEGLGMPSPSKEELCNCVSSSPSAYYHPDNVCGCIPRYSLFKVGHEICK